MSDENYLRDRFAAAALTGLTHPEDCQAGPLRMELVCTMAYRWADAMLRERAKTNHDAAPAARARTNAAGISRQGTGETPVTEPMPKEKPAEVSVSEPVAWAVTFDSTGEIDCEFVYQDEATAGDVASDSNGSVVPLYRHPQPTLADAEREAVESAIWDYEQNDDDDGCARMVAALRGLLERLK